VDYDSAPSKEEPGEHTLVSFSIGEALWVEARHICDGSSGGGPANDPDGPDLGGRRGRSLAKLSAKSTGRTGGVDRRKAKNGRAGFGCFWFDWPVHVAISKNKEID